MRTKIAAPSNFLFYGAGFHPGGSVVFASNNSGVGIGWNGIAVPTVYSLVGLNALGVPQWSKLISPSLTLSLYRSIRPLVDATGRTYISDWIGRSDGQWTYDGVVQGSIPLTSKGAFLLAVDESGNKRWAKSLWSAHTDAISETRPFASALDQNGDLVIAAWADIDAGTGPYGTSDELAFVRFDGAGNPTLIGKIPAAQVKERSGMIIDSGGTIYFTGTYQGTYALDGAQFSCSVGRCGFAVSLSSSGALLSKVALEGCSAGAPSTRFSPPALHAGGIVFTGVSRGCTLGGTSLPTGMLVAHFDP